jgi:serine/threonine protein kinase
MLAGRRPFEKTDTEFTIQKQIVDGKIPSPVKFNSNIPKQLAKIVLKSIAQDPAKRFQKAEDMLLAIEEFEQGKKVSANLNTSVSSFSIGNKKPLVYGAAFLSIIIFFILLVSFGVFESNGKIKPGLVTINTVPPNASISINNKMIGQSPVNEFEVNAGTAQIKIQKDGYLSIDTNLLVEEDEESLFAFNLEKEIVEEIADKSNDRQTDNTKIQFGRVQINSSPAGSDVYLNGKRVGETPFEDNEVRVGSYNLIIRNKDFIDYKRTFKISEEQMTPISATLTPAGFANIESKPNGSIVYLNGNKLGTTPINNQKLREGEFQLKFSKQGFKDLDTLIIIKQRERANLIAELKLSSGKFNLLVRPYGSVYINNKLISENSIAQISQSLSVGNHRIKAVHPSLGTWEKQVEIAEDKTIEYVIDFNREHEVIVTSTPINAQIIIDGQPSGKYTPKLIRLKMGNHSISVMKEGHSLVGREMNLVIENDLKETPLHFDLKKE